MPGRQNVVSAASAIRKCRTVVDAPGLNRDCYATGGRNYFGVIERRLNAKKQWTEAR